MDIRQVWNEKENSWFIALTGEIDIYNAPQLKESLLKMLEQNKGNIIMDCLDLKYIDSTGLGVLISALRRVKDYDGNIVIKHLKPYIHKIFVLTGLYKIFTIQVEE